MPSWSPISKTGWIFLSLDAQIDPATFASVIPDGYELMYKVNAENLEEGKQLVDGLKYFAEINDGKYPATLSVRGVVIEIGGIYQAKSGDPSFGIDDAKVSTLKYGAQFYETLQADGKDAVYNGPAITAADTRQSQPSGLKTGSSTWPARPR